LNASRLTLPFESVLKSQRIHHRAKHSDVVTLGGIHAFHRSRSASPEVSTANDDGDINTKVLAKVDDLASGCVKRRAIKSAT
jgi:hypothetical protein